MTGPLLFSRKPGGPVVLLDGGSTTGNIFFVHSGTGNDSEGYGSEPDKPFATIDYAIGKCTANQGDRIYVMPGHAENLTSATSLVIDVAGIQIIGLGYGGNKPKLTYTTAAAATISMTAANVLFDNFYLYSDYTNGITAAMNIGPGADHFVMRNITIQEGANTKEFLKSIIIADECDNGWIDNFEFFGVAGGDTAKCIDIDGDSDFLKITNFRIFGDFSGTPLGGSATAGKYIEIGPGVIVNEDTTTGESIVLGASNTGMIHDMRIYQNKDTVGVTATGCGFSEVYVTNAAGAQGIFNPAADA